MGYYAAILHMSPVNYLESRKFQIPISTLICKRKLKAAWTWMAPLSKVMSVTSSGGDYFGHRRYKSVEPQGPTELHKGVSTAGCSRGMRARNLRGQTRAGARAEFQHGVQVAPATEGWAVQRG